MAGPISWVLLWPGWPYRCCPAILKSQPGPPFMWLAAMLPVLIAVQFPTRTGYLVLGFVLCAFAYSSVYARLTQFKWCIDPATLRSRDIATA